MWFPPHALRESGGWRWDSPSDVLHEVVTSSGPTWGGSRLLDQPVGTNPAPDGWQASILNLSGTSPVNVAVICMPANSTAAPSLFLPLIVR